MGDLVERLRKAASWTIEADADTRLIPELPRIVRYQQLLLEGADRIEELEHEIEEEIDDCSSVLSQVREVLGVPEAQSITMHAGLLVERVEELERQKRLAVASLQDIEQGVKVLRYL